jgi:hypothetical protein
MDCPKTGLTVPKCCFTSAYVIFKCMQLSWLLQIEHFAATRSLSIRWACIVHYYACPTYSLIFESLTVTVLSATCSSLLYYAADKTSCNKLTGTRHPTSWLDKQHSYFSGGRFQFRILARVAASQYFRQFLQEKTRVLPILKSSIIFFRLFFTNYKPFVIIYPNVW